MAYKAYLQAVDRYHDTVKITVRFYDAGLDDAIIHTFQYNVGSIVVATARAEIIAYRDRLNAVDNKIAQLQTLVGTEVT